MCAASVFSAMTLTGLACSIMHCNTCFTVPCSDSLSSYAIGLPCHAVIVCTKHSKGECCYDGQQHCYCNKKPLHMQIQYVQHALILTKHFHDLCFAAAADSLGPCIQCAFHMSRPVLPYDMRVPA